MSKTCEFFCQQSCKDQIHNLSFLLYDSSSNSEKLGEIPCLDMYTPFCKITNFVVLNNKGEICEMTDRLPIYL